MPVIRTDSEDSTIQAGAGLGARLKPGDVVLLIGNLGAGKTTLVKGIAGAIHPGYADEVSSPTFSLVHEYGDREPVIYHIDLYRLDTAAEVATIGFDEILDRRGIVLIEWGERFPGLMPPEHITVRINRVADESREIIIEGLTS
jgi:tRNA threonylcarbamoyladenosine biosynthesis protein TsaE